MRVSIHFFLIVLILTVTATSSMAYSYTIKGIAKGLREDKIKLSCPAWFEDVYLSLGYRGEFSYSGEFDHPAMFTLTYGEGFEMLKADLFILDDIEIEVELVSEEEEERVFIRIPSHRSTGFKKAKDFLDHIFIGKSTHPSVTDNIIDMIVNQPYIGEDSLTQVFALSEKLNYLMVLREDYGKNIPQSIFDMQEFYDLPINDPRYLGLEGYKNIMVRYNERVVSDTSYRPAGVDDYETEFGKRLFILDSYKKGIPELLIMEVTKNLLKRFPFQGLPDEERSLYIMKLVDLTSKYPNNLDAQELKESLDFIVNSVENTKSEPFELINNKGEVVRSDIFEGKPILIDVWGSWCRPCRINNRKLIQLEADCVSEGLDVQFISVAKETDLTAWRAAIRQDGLTWTQLRSNDTFLRNYRITQYPTVILIDQNGIIRKVGATTSLTELKELFY